MSYTHMGTLQRRRFENTHPTRDFVSVGLHLGRAKWLLGFGPGSDEPWHGRCTLPPLSWKLTRSMAGKRLCF